jgi:sugar lactone lactonase YvrE
MAGWIEGGAMLRNFRLNGRRRRTTGALGIVALAILACGPGVATATAATVSDSQQLTSFSPNNNFIESIALSPSGALYASVTHWNFSGGSNTGQVYRITSSGKHIPYGPTFEKLGSYGLLTGLTFDQAGHLYLGVVADGGAKEHFIAPGVMRVSEDAATRVLTLPAHSFPNGLATHASLLYATDSYKNGIWRTDPTKPAVQQHPWLTDPLLAPRTAGNLGADGIAFHGNMMTISVYHPGRLVQAVLPRTGRPTLHLVSNDPRLLTSDGLAYDNQGRLWITVNGIWTQDPSDPNVFHGAKQYLLMMTTDGKLRTMDADASRLNYATMIAFSPVRSGHQMMFLSNGGFYGGPVNILTRHITG